MKFNSYNPHTVKKYKFYVIVNKYRKYAFKHSIKIAVLNSLYSSEKLNSHRIVYNNGVRKNSICGNNFSAIKTNMLIQNTNNYAKYLSIKTFHKFLEI